MSQGACPLSVDADGVSATFDVGQTSQNGPSSQTPYFCFLGHCDRFVLTCTIAANAKPLVLLCDHERGVATDIDPPSADCLTCRITTSGNAKMIYHVRARLRVDTAPTFLAKLTDGTIEKQRPDGPELVASMKRAVINAGNEAEWTELCYCEPPLAHERATVLDSHFDHIRAEPIEGHTQFEGEPFMDYLRALVSRQS